MDLITINIPQSQSWTDNDLFEFCMANQDLEIERDKNGFIQIMAPAGSLSGYFSGEVFFYLKKWTKEKKLGYAFDSSAGFILPSGAMRSPDASWVSNAKCSTLTLAEKQKFAPICPEFVVEVKSPSDSLTFLQQKMEEWLENGAKLGWLIDPNEQIAFDYRPKQEVEKIDSFDKSLNGEPLLSGFEFDLSILTNP